MLNKKQEKAVKLMISGQNVFITGSGGVGKSYVINEYKKWCDEHDKNYVVCATTGIAALNVEGITMHAGFAIPVPAYGKDPNIVPMSKLKILQNTDVVIIDEISLARCDAFDFAIRIKERIEKFVGRKIQIIVVGDFFQLPPVVTKDDESKLRKFGYDPSGFCFTTKAWKRCKFKVIELDEAVRQSDKEFIDNLNKVRKGDRTCVKYFAKREITLNSNDEEILYLCPSNNKADEINQGKLSLINEPAFAYQAEISGHITNDKPADDVLILKKGCRVIVTANDVVYNNYMNGQIGIITECFSNYVKVKFDNGKEIELYPHKWDICTYKISGGLLKREGIGYFKQIPLKLAYAITIHKAQGQTLEKAIIQPNVFTDGQFYVAISRIKSIEGLYFDGEVLPMHIKVNSKVMKFYENYEWDIPEGQIKKQNEVEKKQKAASKKNTKKKTSKTTVNKKKSTNNKKNVRSKTRKIIKK